ncbi:unnamed protein product [Polarella glacialis]|uniref:Uncharacterized protein n=1 Tax=Polarella glacialis TaxID=89957 RepID=A0A813LQZ0_POLGL|nr:unnamed protein product [Polarella glacialis]
MFACCSACRSTTAEEVFSRSGEHRQLPRGSGLPDFSPGGESGAAKAELPLPWAVLTSGVAEILGISPAVEPPVDAKEMLRPAVLPSWQDPAAKALEHSRLKDLVRGFVREASDRGRLCSVLPLGVGGPGGAKTVESGALCRRARLEARYQLCDEDRRLCRGVCHVAERLVLSRKVSSHEAAGDRSTDGGWEVFASWQLVEVLGVHRAEDSALVQRHQPELDAMFNHEAWTR